MKLKYILLTIPLLLLLSCEKKAPAQTAALSIEGTIAHMAGMVTVDGRTAEPGTRVKDGEVVQTGPEGFCEIQFLDANIIRIYEDSIIKISFSESTVSLEKGAAAAVLRNLGDFIKTMDDVFTVKSGTVVAGIRGTSFYMKREDPQTSYFCLCNGKIELSDGGKQFSRNLESTHHKAVRIREDNRKLEVSQAPMLYHTDA
ncbi:MAG: FecR family protein, partial [Spirochaetales bacterium]|nr:FecR family protein [Spirochaetales bacterium]